MRKAVARGDTYKGVFSAAHLPAIAGVLPTDENFVKASVRFDLDEDQRFIAEVQFEARVELVCQRSLNRFTAELSGGSTLGLIVSESQSGALPKAYEPWIVSDETDLWDMVSEEVSLALPTVPIDPESEYSLESNETKADPQAISTNLGERGDSGGSGDKSEEGVKRANPFEILSQLVVDKK
ncbi:MAG: YceD family protein [Pseudomonadota bacterium]